ncbi:centrosomal protein of 112 kDa isoform X3 [Siphateles boraxobius]|uniref:centrosomal protein of 112 kDa isoform X3 n=1 Tax=Siphateles boraxobius TaxID=180520 RepID=UPI0040638AFA
MSDQDSFGILDSEFDHYLVDMKPFVLKLTHKTERQRCALWIKKLCDPAACGSGLTGRKNRNMYARLLLHMLTRGALEGPFTHIPDAGGLKTLPTYMSIYFDEPLLGSSDRDQRSAVLPDWVCGELGQSDGSWVTSPLSNTHRNLISDKTPARPLSSSPVKHDIKDDAKMAEAHRRLVSSDDSDFEARFNSWNLGIENPRYLRENPVPLSPIYKSSRGRNSTLCDEASPVKADKEVELRTKVLEAKHQEDTLRMQQKHDAEIQKILDRKNGEIDELKSMYRGKQKEAEETVRRLEKRVQSLLRESQVIRQTKEKQISELKKMSDQSAESLKNQWEKKFHAAVAEMEQEKFEMQKQHTDNIQELLEDTNQRLAKMEAEYSGQNQATEQMVHELESRVKQLSVEVKNGNLLRQKVTQEKAELEIHIASISAELQEANHRAMSLQIEMEQMRNQHEDSLQKQQARHNADMSHFQQEHTLSAAKASEVIEDLEQTVILLKQEIQETENRRQRQLRDQENKMQQEITDLQNSTVKKLQTLQAQLEKERVDSKRKISKMEDSLRDKDEQLVRARDSQRHQAHQAEKALENFKKQVELSSEKTYADMKQQMQKVECDLMRSKSLREKQCKESCLQMEELQRTYEQQTISDLESQVRSLRKELLAAHSQRTQQLTELGLLREEERQRAAHEQQTTLDRMRAEMDQVRQELERSHKTERELAQEKTNSKLKHLEKEYNQKLAKSAQVIAELQTSLNKLKEDSRQIQQSLETQIQEEQSRWDQERTRLNRDADQANKVLQGRVETLQKQLHAVEKKLMSRELEYQEQITHVHQECELKIKGLMPAELQQELNDTITSLKSQVNFLQKRASVLQEQLDAGHIRR